MIYTFPRNAQQHGTEEKKFFSIVLFWRFFFFFVFVHPLHSSSSAPTTTTWLISFDSCQHCVASHSLLNLRMKCLRGCMLCTLRCCSRLRLCLCNSIEKSFEVFISPLLLFRFVCLLFIENAAVRCTHTQRTEDSESSKRIEENVPKGKANFYVITTRPQYDDEIYCAEKTRSEQRKRESGRHR